MCISEKIKTTNNKIEQNKARYDLNIQTAKISALSSENVSKYEFLTDKDALPGKDLLEKAAALKRFEYSPLGKKNKSTNWQISNKETVSKIRQYWWVWWKNK